MRGRVALCFASCVALQLFDVMNVFSLSLMAIVTTGSLIVFVR